MQDATAQMAILQFMLSGKKEVAIPTTVHCDHLIVAKEGFKKDMEDAIGSNQEVYDFLSSASSHYGIGFWKPGSGIIHQVVLENYAFPGGLIIGTDSHTPNAGGLGMLAIGVGGADATDVMAGFPWEVRRPSVVGVHLKGAMGGWVASKDVILKLLEILTVKGGTNRIIEYFGEGCETISCTGKGTICNMGAELGATSSVFPFDSKMLEYLRSTQRESIAKLVSKYSDSFQPDPEVLKNPSRFYEKVIEIDLSRLKPQVCGPHSPDRVRTLNSLKKECKTESWPLELSVALIGSCTNSSYEDIGRAVHVAKQAKAKGFKMPQPFFISPGSDQIKKTIERDGYMKALNDIGGVVLSNACGPCIGQWSRPVKKGTVNTIISSFNRNFRGRNDANPETLSFLTSPEITIAIGLSGRLDFDPETDSLEQDGKTLKLNPPIAPELPEAGFVFDFSGFQEPQGAEVEVQIRPSSERLAKLDPFPAPDLKDFKAMLVLCKARGKCTTDHISPAGFWLKYRGHLDKISNNLLLGATDDFSGEIGRGFNVITGKRSPFSDIARDYKLRQEFWIIIGDENYGEGSSREHAAMTPRYLGAKAVIVKSFARIHETNLKKQGVLPLTFVEKSDYNKIQKEDRIAILELDQLQPGSRHAIKLTHKDRSVEEFFVQHSLNKEQIQWFYKGSSLNVLRESASL